MRWLISGPRVQPTQFGSDYRGDAVCLRGLLCGTGAAVIKTLSAKFLRNLLRTAQT
jgi:hypothetical protein